MHEKVIQPLGVGEGPGAALEQAVSGHEDDIPPGAQLTGAGGAARDRKIEAAGAADPFEEAALVQSELAEPGQVGVEQEQRAVPD